MVQPALPRAAVALEAFQHIEGMEEAGAGAWKAELELAPGRYEYKFVVDGRWCCDPGRDDHDLSVADCVQNSFGTLNRVIDVE